MNGTTCPAVSEAASVAGAGSEAIAARRSAEPICAYLAAIASVACPSTAATVSRPAPARRSRVAVVCRRSWKRKSSRPAFSTARRWRCNLRHTREIPGPGSPRRGRRRPSAELGCREGKPVWNLSRKRSDLEKPEQGTGGSIRRDSVPRFAPRRNGRTASIHTQPANRFGARGPGPV